MSTVTWERCIFSHFNALDETKILSPRYAAYSYYLIPIQEPSGVNYVTLITFYDK